MLIDETTLTRNLPMLRNDWKFSYTTEQLLEAAKAKLDYRLSRVSFWQSRLDEAMETLKTSGIEVTESVAAAHGSTYNSRRGTTIQIDPKIEAQVDECQEKLKEHRTEAAAYRGWVEVFTGNPGLSLDLKYGDWLYFFGRDA